MKSLRFTDLHTIKHTRSGTRERVVVLPPSETPPTVNELLSLFQEDTQVGDQTLDELIADMDILEETYVVGEEDLITGVSEEITQDHPAALSLQVYYHRAEVSTDVDLIPEFGWAIISYLPVGQDAYVCHTYIGGQECQVWRTTDGFIAQPLTPG